MATYATLLRKLVTAYFNDRQAKDEGQFPRVTKVMQAIPLAKRENIAELLADMADAVRATACQHTDVTKVDNEHETCNTCGYKRAAYWTGQAEEDLQMHWGRWRKVVTQKIPS